MSYTAMSACCAVRTCEYRDGPPAKSKNPTDEGTTCAWDFLESKLLARSWLGRGQSAQHIWHTSGLLRRCCSRCSDHAGSGCVRGPWGDPHSTRAAAPSAHTRGPNGQNLPTPAAAMASAALAGVQELRQMAKPPKSAQI